ncbi:DUF3027 domain-containing protein [Amycolatopsis sp. NPDC051102]|uniref:DUF3027 domain-containing protein n=1 Tax=Amycolatopsis sp. NPDC051102 TaxID=3155163 RepID=UPI003424EF7B
MTLLLTLDDGSVQRKLADAVEFARAAVLEDAPEEQLGAHVGVTREDAVTASHLFEAQVPGYGGWRWSVTVALAGDDEPVTVSEVVLVPGPSALVAPAWVPWERRVRAGDLGVGDIFPTDENDPRLAPAYLQSDDPAVEETAREVGLGRVHVLSRFGRTEAASRWHAGEFGPRSDMARSAPDVCGTCGFFVPLAGSLRGVFGVCSNDIAPADGHVVDVEYGCGAHSEVEVEVTSSVPVAELVYDDSLLDFAPAPEVVEAAVAEGETGVAESDVSPAEVEPEAASEAAEVAEPVAAEAAAPVEAGAEAPAAVEAEPVEAGAETPAAAEAEAVEADAPVVAEAESVAVEAESVEPAAEAPAAAGEVAEPVVAEVPEPADAEPTQAEVTDAVEVRTAPEAVAAEVPEPAEAEPTQADVTDAAEVRAASEPAQVEPVVPEPADAEPTQAEVTDAAEVRAAPEAAQAEPVEAEPAESEPAQAEVTDAVELPAAPELVGTAADSEPVAAESDAAEVDPLPADVAAQAGDEAEVPEAALTDTVVTEGAEAGQADEAQAQLDNDR